MDQITATDTPTTRREEQANAQRLFNNLFAFAVGLTDKTGRGSYAFQMSVPKVGPVPQEFVSWGETWVKLAPGIHRAAQAIDERLAASIAIHLPIWEKGRSSASAQADADWSGVRPFKQETSGEFQSAKSSARDTRGDRAVAVAGFEIQAFAFDLCRVAGRDEQAAACLRHEIEAVMPAEAPKLLPPEA